MRFSIIFKIKLQSIKDEQKRSSQLERRRIRPHHIHWIKEFWERFQDKRITWSLIRKELLESFSDVRRVSLVTIAWWLKTWLRMPYRRLESKPAPAFRTEIIRKLFESAWLQMNLEQNRIENIFIDKFKFSSKHCRFRGWAPRWKKGFVKSHSDNLHANFVVALSKRKIYGIMASEVAFNVVMFQRFVEEMLYMFRAIEINTNEIY